VIWLRTQIERGSKHPWLGPLFLVLLLLLLVFVAAHATMDQAHGTDASELVCIVLGILVLLAPLVPRPPRLHLRVVSWVRGPPTFAVAAPARPAAPTVIPLRL